MWYLNEELLSLSLFHSNYSDDDKSLLTNSILNPKNTSLVSRKPNFSFPELPSLQLTEFVNNQ